MIPVDKVVDVLSGFAFKSSLFNDTGEGLPLVRIRDVGRNSSGTFYTGEYKDEYVLKNGDFIIGMDGDFRLAEWYGGQALLNQRVCKITPKEELINPKYLYYFLPKKLKEIEDRTSFATVKHLSVKGIKAIEIPLPPLEEQKKIAAILDAADQLRQKDQLLIAKYNTLNQSLFLEMFGDVFVNDRRFTKIPLKDVIEKVQIGPFGSQLHKHDYITDGIPLVNPTHIIEKKIVPNNLFTLSKGKYGALPNYHLKTNDIIMARRGEMGRCAIVTEKESNYFCGTGSLYIRPSELLNSWFLLYALSGDSGVSYLEKNSQGVTMMNLNKTIILNLEIGVPPLPLQNQFAERIRAIEVQKQQAQACLVKSQALFHSLLQRAFKGELTA